MSDNLPDIYNDPENNVDIWGVDQRSNNGSDDVIPFDQSGPYAEYAGFLERGMSFNLEMPGSFVDAAKLSPDLIVEVEGLLNLATLELNARCNQRLTMIDSCIFEIKIIDDYIRKYQESKHTTFDMVFDEYSLKQAENRKTELNEEIIELRKKIDKAKRNGVYRDYKRFCQSYINPSIKVDKSEWPFFLQKVLDLCISNTAGTRKDHLEHLVARLASGSVLKADEQRQLQRQRVGSRRGGFNSDGGDDQW